MQQNQVILLLLLFSFLIYSLTYIKKRPEALLFFFGRSAVGLSFIHVFNLFCSTRDIVTGVTVNPLTACICAFLGIPGVLLAYAVKLCSFL